ncbi:hypothetical protein [Paenibacillus polymyxa]|nr:hypothetical protein [Paenibacillus polymyxa]WPQ54514.1 hypothetical protein SKN87_12895 [Paenibacillus polymyxa]
MSVRKSTSRAASVVLLAMIVSLKSMLRRHPSSGYSLNARTLILR